MRRLDAVVLAAGRSVRFGSPKLLARFRGAPLVAGALAAARAAPVMEVVVVTGANRESVEAAARSAPGDGAPYRFIEARDYELGMSASLKAGLRALSCDAHAAFVFLGDMPLIPTTAAQALADGLGDNLAAVPLYGGRRGHPALITRRLFSAILAVEGDAGARAVLDGLTDGLVAIPVEGEGGLYDVDHPADLEAAPVR